METISAQFDVSVRTVHTIIREELKMRFKFFPRELREDQKKDVVMTAGRWLSWSIQMPQFLMLWWPAMKAVSTAMTQRPRDRVPSGSMLALPDPRRSDRANPPTDFWWSLFFDSTGMIYMHWVPTGQTVEVLRSSERDSIGRSQHPSNRLSGISSGTLYQSTTPSLSQAIWPRWASRQFPVPHSSYSPDLVLCDF